MKDWSYLVGILHDEVLALLELHTDVDDTAQDAPGVLHVQVDLVGELSRLKLLRAQDHMLCRVTHMHTGHIPIERGRSNLVITNYCIYVTICS